MGGKREGTLAVKLDKELPMKRITIDPVTRIEGHAKITDSSG